MTIDTVIAPQETDPDLRKLYDGFAASRLIPLWTEVGNLMPLTPQPEAVPHIWQWDTLDTLLPSAGVRRTLRQGRPDAARRRLAGHHHQRPRSPAARAARSLPPGCPG